MNKELAFIDEFGDPSLQLEKPNITSHYIIVCILIPEESMNPIRENLEAIRSKYFQKGEIKSSKVGNDDVRRMTILNKLNELDFKVLALVVNKKELNSKGFQYKKSFYKYLNGIIHKELRRVFDNLDIFMDEHGDEKFMHSFLNYIWKEFPKDLFATDREVVFVDSKSNLFIQLADFIAGTLGRIYDDTKKSDISDRFLTVLRNNLVSVIKYPIKYERLTFVSKDVESKQSPQIATLSCKLAADFIEKYNNSKDYNRAIQVSFLNLFLMYSQTINYNKYVSTSEIIDHLNYNSQQKITPYFLRTNIVGKLRDEGVIIASGKLGYKLPTSLSDLYDYLNHGNTVILPMLGRLKKCIETIKLNTNIDLLENKVEYKDLKKLYLCLTSPES